MSKIKKLRNRRIQMIHIQDHLCPDDIYRKAYNRAISMILGGTFKVEAHVILDDYEVFFPWYNRGNLQSVRAFKKYNGY